MICLARVRVISADRAMTFNGIARVGIPDLAERVQSTREILVDGCP
jgi:hypothetical protein